MNKYRVRVAASLLAYDEYEDVIQAENPWKAIEEFIAKHPDRYSNTSSIYVYLIRELRWT